MSTEEIKGKDSVFPIKTDARMVKFPTTARELFDLLDEFMIRDAVPNYEQERVWDALTALRGPDTDESEEAFEMKHSTTTLIRGAVFRNPKTSVYDYAIMDVTDTDWRVDVRTKLMDEYMNGKHPHFIAHAKRAFEALGLDWYVLNESLVK